MRIHFYNPLSMSFNYFRKKMNGVDFPRYKKLAKKDYKDNLIKPHFN